MSRDADAACRAALRNGSRSFALAALVLPRGVRGRATALYAFCRAADDAVDLAPDGAAGLAGVRARLDALYRGTPVLPEDGAFAALRLPRALPDALLEGFAWDVAGRRYATLDELAEYAMRVAGSVGLMMAAIMGVRDPAALAAAAELGCAMQLTNIARDVGEDAAAGRLYLPLDWLAEAGIDAGSWLRAPVFGPALGGVVARLLAEAERRYARAVPGIAALPVGCRPAIRAAAAFYAAIGDEVARRGYDSVSGRAVVPLRRKLVRFAVGMGTAPVRECPMHELVAIAARSAPASAPTFAPGSVPASAPAAPVPGLVGRIDDRLGWTIELFARLGRDAEQARPARVGRMAG